MKQHKEKEDLVWHYTTLSALTGILTKDNLCFRATRYDSLNDPTEKVYAERKIMPNFKKWIEKDENIDESYKDGFMQYPYVISFSHKKDDILMWRLYNGEVALVLDKEVIENNKKYVTHKCEYPKTKTEMEGAFLSIYNSVNANCSDAISQGYQTCCFIKHPSFAIEDEYRVAAFDGCCMKFYENPSSPGEIVCQEVEHPKEIKFKQNGQDLIPYKELIFPKNALKRIILYSFDAKLYALQKCHIELLLKSLEYSNVDVVRTNSIAVRRTVKTN